MELIRLTKAELAPLLEQHPACEYTDYDGVHPKWKGRRCSFLPGHGATLFVEGVHFIVLDDNSYLPVLQKDNAEEGLCYKGAGNGVMFVQRLYRLTEEQAKADRLVYLDRVVTSAGEFALPGSDIRSDIRTID